MLSSPLPPNHYEFREVQTAQGRVMVSADLLTISSAATDASPDILSSQSESTDGMSPPTLYSLSTTTTSPSMPIDDVAAVCTESVASAYPDAHVPAPLDNDLLPVDPQLYAPAPYKTVQLQSRLATSRVLPPDVSGEAASAPPDTGGDVPTKRAAPLPPQQISTEALHQHGQSSSGYFIDENGRSIPSYMSPQAIRARNLILKCDLPRRPQTIPVHGQDQVRHVSFSDESLSPKRRKVDGDCGTRAGIDGLLS